MRYLVLKIYWNGSYAKYWLGSRCRAYEEDVLGGLNKLRDITVTGSIGFIIFGIVVAMLLSKSISNPIVELTSVIERMSNYDITIDKSSKDNELCQ